MWRDAALICGKDLRLEWRSRVILNQVVPFSLLVLILFAFALDPDRGLLVSLSAGLYWVAVLFSAVLTIQRSFSVEATDGARDGLRMSGLDPAGMFLGKAGAIGALLLGLEVVLGVGVVLFYDTQVSGFPLLVATCLVATAGLVSAGSIYGVLSAGARVRETLLPLLFLPLVAPVLIGATEAFDAALAGRSGDGWAWVGLLGVFAIIYTAAGMLAFGPLLEDS